MLKSFLFPRSVPCFFLIFLFFMQNGIMKELGKMFNRNFVDGWYSSSSSGEPASVGYNPTRTLVMYLSLFLFYSILDICFSKYNSRMDTFQFRTCCKWCRHQMVFWIGHRLIGRAIQVGNDAIIRSCMSFNYHAPIASWSGSWWTCFKRDGMTVWTESQILSLWTMERDESYLNTSAAVHFCNLKNKWSGTVKADWATVALAVVEDNSMALDG